MARPKSTKNIKSPKLVDELKSALAPKNIPLPSITVPSFSAGPLLAITNQWRKNRVLTSSLVIIVLVGVVGSMLYFKKHWFVAALVNNRPVTTVEVIARMYQTYKKDTIDQMINEKVIFNEAKKQGAMPSRADIQNKISEIEERFGGKSEFEKLLTENGQTRLNLEMNVKTVLAMEKLYGELLTVTDEDINTYLKENTVKGTDEASRREEAKKAAKEKKLNQLYAQKIQELTENAKIKIF